MEIYANANLAAWQGATRLRSNTLVPTTPFIDATGLSVAATADLGQPTAMRNHKSITRSGFPPRGHSR